MAMNHDELICNDCHPWCRSTARDEAVRAAEDGRQGPLPTLEEAIAAASPLPGRVQGTHWADWERLREERDAAIQRAHRDSVKCSALADNVITLRARVAELESAPAASVAANSSEKPVSSEPVAWGVAANGVLLATSTSRSDAVDMQSEHVCETVVVPLYAAPPRPEDGG